MISYMDQNKKLICIIAVLLPFLVDNFLNDSDYNLTEDDKKQVKMYKLYWYIFWWILLANFVIFLVNNYFYPNPFFNIINFFNSISWWLLVMFLFYTFYNIIFDKKDSKIMYYIPILNFYFWYYKWDTDSNHYLKESIFLWRIFVLLCFLYYPLAYLALIFIIFRAISLEFNYDFLKKKNYFNTNIEEIYSYVIWYIKYIFNRKKNIQDHILETKKLYQNLLIPSYDFSFIFQYFILILFSIFMFKNIMDIYVGPSSIIYLWYFIFISRYIILLKINRYPLVPFIYEISLIFNRKNV